MSGNKGSVATADAVVGSLLIGASWSVISRLMRIGDYPPQHQLILKAVEALASNDEPYNVISVANQLERMGHLQAVGGHATLSELARNTPTAATAAIHARELSKQALLQKLPEDFRNDPQVLRRTLDELDSLESPEPLSTAPNGPSGKLLHRATG